MLFFTRKWLFFAAAIVAGTFILVELWATTGLIFADTPEEFGVPVALLGITLSLMCLLMAFVYVFWLKKYYYFFMLQRLAKERSERAEESIFHVRLEDGTAYSMTGTHPIYSIIKVLPNSNTQYVYTMTDKSISALSKTTETAIDAHDGYIGEQHTVQIHPVLLNHLETFKELTRALSQ